MNLVFLFLLVSQIATAASRDVDGNVVADDATRNDSLFNSTVNPDPTDPEPSFSQKDTFTLQSNLMYGCVDTSLNGRSDDVCQSNPKAPECVGLSASLSNATNCLEYIVPANPALGCKTYGTAEHPMEDWIAFGNNYFNTLAQCSDTKTSNDTTKKSLKSLTEMIAFDPTSPVGSGPSILSGAQKSGINSSISVGNISDENDWNNLLNKFDDGASRLGYQNGDLIKSAQKKQSFFDVVTSSPFAEDLNVVNRAKIESGIADASFIVERVKANSKLAKSETENPETMADISASNSSKNEVVNQNIREEKTESGAANQLPSNPIIAEAKSLEAPAVIRKQTLAERIAEIERLAKEQRKNRSIASLEEKNSELKKNLERRETSNEDKTLFQRVALVYKKHHARLKYIEPSRVGASILELEKPAIFNDL
jgi:hypothetical protein